MPEQRTCMEDSPQRMTCTFLIQKSSSMPHVIDMWVINHT